MKQYPIIMQDFSIAGIKKQWERQQKEQRVIAGHRRHSHHPHPSRVETFNTFGCKTETRRLTGLKKINKNPDEWTFLQIGDSGQARFKPKGSEVGALETWIKCPYGVIGDEIWVREKWCKFYSANEDRERIHYAEDGIDGPLMKWKSPLYMPCEASRITLINAGVSIERLHNITEEGAIREGITKRPGSGCFDADGFAGQTATEAYGLLWIAMHGFESWNLNPWVWVLKFTVKEIRQ